MTGSRVEVALLGPVECRIDGRAVVIRSRKQRAILSALALRSSEVISTERLIEAVWGEDPPPAARNSLEAHVSRLRKLLEENGAPAEVLRTQSPGYAFTGTTDLAQFEQLRTAAAGRADDRAAELLASALALWRGAALADLADEPFAAVEAPRLEELRLATREELIRSRLALGDDRWAVHELETLVAEHPLRERLRELLMLAYYRCGRQAEALEQYRETSDRLRSELGLEPNPGLRSLEQAILRHDPALQSAAPAVAVEAEREAPEPSPRPKRRRAWWAIPPAAAAAAAAIVLGLLLTGGSHAHRLTRPVPLGKHLLASISSPLPSCCAFGFGGVWVVGHHDQTVEKIGPVKRKVVARYPIAGFQAEAPLIAAGSLWVPAAGEAKFVRFDPVRKRVVATYPTTAAEIAWGYNSIWATTRDHQLLRINLRTNRIIGSISGFGNTNSWMPVTTGDGSVWVSRVTGDQDIVYRIDPYTNQIVKRIPVGRRGVAWPNGYMLDAVGYVRTCDGGTTMSAIDPRTNTVVAWYTVPESCQEVAYGLGSIWTALYDHSLVYRIDPKA